MSVYMSEEEQVQMLKSWWKKYGNIVTIFISVVLLLIAGVRYWNWHKNSISQQASAIYERMMVAYADKDYKQVRSNSQRLVDDFKNTVYADGASLIMAKIAINHEKYKTAERSLALVIANSRSQVIVNIARIRMARLLLNEKKYKEAQLEISKVVDQSLQPIVKEVQGDIAIAQDHKSEAMRYYKAAINEDEKNGSGNLFLQMKSNRLSAMS